MVEGTTEQVQESWKKSQENKTGVPPAGLVDTSIKVTATEQADLILFLIDDIAKSSKKKEIERLKNQIYKTITNSARWPRKRLSEFKERLNLVEE